MKNMDTPNDPKSRNIGLAGNLAMRQGEFLAEGLDNAQYHTIADPVQHIQQYPQYDGGKRLYRFL